MEEVAAAVPVYFDEVEEGLLHNRNAGAVAAEDTDWGACNALEAVLEDL